jgi:CPA2 family monovalent cation:H+ antiporter-2
MTHGLTLITTIAAGFGLALLLGFVAVRLGLPALIGYLLAGVLIGPATPGYVADLEIAGQLAEIGVMLLMFGVGLHFSLQDLLSVRRIALPGAVVQIAVATALGAGLAALWGWKLSSGIVFGFALSVASTVVLLRALESRGELESVNGRIAVGWLVVEDLVTVLVLVLMPPLAVIDAPTSADAGAVLGRLAATVGEIGVFVVLMLVVGRRVFPWLLWQVARTGSRELFTLCVIAAALGIAYGSSALFGASFALGAFFAGMVLRESDLSYRAAQESLPLRDAFSVLFFVSVGMLFDPAVVLSRPLEVLAVVAVILAGKSVAAFLLVLAFRYPLKTALTVSASLAQIGEFSFILAGLGVTLGVLPVDGQNFILAGAIISIAVNPIVFRTIEPVEHWFRARPVLLRWLERGPDPLAALPPTAPVHEPAGHVVLAGYGRVGRRIGEALRERGLPFVVVEENRELVERLREQGGQAVAGDASDPQELIQAGISRARMLVVAIPDAFQARQIIEAARTLNPGIETVVRTHSEEEAELLRRENVGKVFMGEHELAVGMARHVLERVASAEGVT